MSLGPTLEDRGTLETTSNLKIFAYILITKFLDREEWREGKSGREVGESVGGM